MVRVNRILLVVIPLGVLILATEAARWVSAASQVSVAPLRPDLASLQKASAAVPELRLSQELFPVKQEPRTPAVQQKPGAQVAGGEVEWKLLGTLLTPAKRAYLEDSKTKQTMSVSEGDRLGEVLVKRIDARAVLLEREGKEYEIRL